MRVVVADTSPINYLVLIGTVDILCILYTRVLVPVEVFNALTAPGSPRDVAAWAHGRPEWMEIAPSLPVSEPALDELDAGERAAIRLALTELDVLLLIDEAAGRSAASKLGLANTGTPGVLKVAAERGLVNLRSSLEKLRQTNFHISTALMDSMLSGADGVDAS